MPQLIATYYDPILCGTVLTGSAEHEYSWFVTNLRQIPGSAYVDATTNFYGTIILVRRQFILLPNGQIQLYGDESATIRTVVTDEPEVSRVIPNQHDWENNGVPRPRRERQVIESGGSRQRS
jgi:hypothetical protein